MEPRGLTRAGKVQIGRVDDGMTFVVEELLSTDSVERLKDKIERVSLIPAADQILLADDGRRLETSQKLEVYGLPNVRQIPLAKDFLFAHYYSGRKINFPLQSKDTRTRRCISGPCDSIGGI